MRPFMFALGLTLLTFTQGAWAETGFWEEMAVPGLTQYRQHVSTAQNRIQAGDFEGAIIVLQQAIGLLEDQSEAHLWLAYCLSAVNRHQQAAPSWQRALQLDQNALDEEAVAFRYTITLARLGQFQEAAQIYTQMLARGLSSSLRPIVLINMADMLVASGCDTLDDAIDLYQEAVRDYPNRAEGHLGLAAALFRAGRLQEARTELATTERLDPQWASVSGDNIFFVPSYESHLYRALSWEQRSNSVQARSAWQAYLDGGGAQGCWADMIRAHMATLQ